MHHLEVAREYSRQMEEDPNHLALILFGSVAKGTARPSSDLDFLLLHQKFSEKFRYNETTFRGIKVGTNYLDYNFFRGEVIATPFNRIIFTTSQIMFDKTGNIPAWIDAIKRYFISNPDIKDEWGRLEAAYEKSKTQPGLEVPDMLDIYLRFRVRYGGRVLQEPIP